MILVFSFSQDWVQMKRWKQWVAMSVGIKHYISSYLQQYLWETCFMTTHLCTVKTRKISTQKCFINVRNFRMLINKYDLMLSITFTHCLRNFRPSSKNSDPVRFSVKRMRKLRTEGAFTPGATEALRANDLHVKSMQRRDRQSCGAIRANEAARMTQFTRLGRLTHELKNRNFRAALTNQELALAVTLLRIAILQRDWSCLAEPLPWREFASVV